MKEQLRTQENQIEKTIITSEMSVSQAADLLEGHSGKEAAKVLIEETVYLTGGKIGLVLKELYDRADEKGKKGFWTTLGDVVKRAQELKEINARAWKNRFDNTGSQLDKGLLINEEELNKARAESQEAESAGSALSSKTADALPGQDEKDSSQQNKEEDTLADKQEENNQSKVRVIFRRGTEVHLKDKRYNKNGPHSGLNRKRNVIERIVRFPEGISEEDRDKYVFIIDKIIESDHYIPAQLGILQEILMLAVPREEFEGKEKAFNSVEEVKAELERLEKEAAAEEESAPETDCQKTSLCQAEAQALNKDSASQQPENSAPEEKETLQAEQKTAVSEENLQDRQENFEEFTQTEEISASSSESEESLQTGQETKTSNETDCQKAALCQTEQPLDLNKEPALEKPEAEISESCEETDDFELPEEGEFDEEPLSLSDEDILDPVEVLKDFDETDWSQYLQFSGSKNPNAQGIHQALGAVLTQQEKAEILGYMRMNHPNMGEVSFKEDLDFSLDPQTVKCARCSHVLYGHNPSPEFLAWLVYTHLCMNISISKLERHLLENHNISIPKKTLNEWLLAACREYLVPMGDLLHKILLLSNYLQLDETYLLCLQDKAEGKNSKGVVVGLNTQDHFLWPIVSFFYRENMKMEFLPEILGEDWEGIIQIDGAPKNPETSTKIVFKGKSVGCWAHFRNYVVNAYREFKEVKEALKIKNRKERRAFMKKACLKNRVLEIVDLLLVKINALQEIENDIERNGYDDPTVLKLRQEESKDLIEKIDKLIKQAWLYKATMPYIAKAITYYKNHRAKLIAFLDDPKIKHSNMQIERLFKSAIQPYRKNSLHCSSHEGAYLRCRALSVLKTAELNKLNVERFLKWAFTYLKEKRDSLGCIDEEVLFHFLPLFTNEIPDDVRLDKSYLKSGSLFQKLEAHPNLTAIPDKNNPLVFTLLNSEPELDLEDTVSLF